MLTPLPRQIATMTTQITRVTMLKVAEDRIDIAMKGFEIFAATQKKVSDADCLPTWLLLTHFR